MGAGGLRIIAAMSGSRLMTSSAAPRSPDGTTTLVPQLASGMPRVERSEHVLYLASEFVPPTGYLTSIHNRRQPGRLALAAGSDERWVRVRAV